MNRTLATAVTALVAGTSVWLATAPAQAQDKASRAAVNDRATLKVETAWTYQGNGKLAIRASCSQRHDLAVVASKMLTYPVSMGHGGNLLIMVMGKTMPGKYTIALWCVPKGGRVDSADVMSVKIMKHLTSFKQPRALALPRHFKASVTVCTGPPAKKTPPAKSKHAKSKPCKKMHPKAPVPASPVSPSAGQPQAS